MVKERAIEEMLVVKFDIESINQDLLANKNTTLQDLEKEKMKLEHKIQQVVKDYNLRLSNEETLQ